MTKKNASDADIEKRNESTSGTTTTSDHHSTLQELLVIPELPSALKKNSEKKFRSVHVLTSEVALQKTEGKERKKREEEERKVRRRDEQEQRARQKAEERLSTKKTLKQKQMKEKACEKRCKFQLQMEMTQNVLLKIVVTQEPQRGLVVKTVKGDGIVCALMLVTNILAGMISFSIVQIVPNKQIYAL